MSHEILQIAANDVIGRDLSLSAEELQTAISPENFVNVRNIYGGTAPSETRRALSVERESEAADEDWFTLKSSGLEKASKTLGELVKERSGSLES